MTVVKSNLRVDISGGTLDLWPLFNFLGEAKTINAGLSLCATSEFKLNSGNEVQINIVNLNYRKQFKNFSEFMICTDQEITILKPLLDNYKFQSGFTLSVDSESPIGGGLGGSSTLMVALIKSIDSELKIKRTENEIVDFACNVESFVLHAPAGTQDYFQAVSAGLSVINYTHQGRHRKFFKSKWLESNKSNFKLIYSGYPHHSGLNNWKIFQKYVNKDADTIRVLQGLKDVSDKVFEDISSGSGSNMSTLLNEELDLRRRLATGYVNEPLEKIISFLQKHDVNHFKICGAGGGGCMWALIPKPLQSSLIEVKSLHPDIRLIDCELII